MANWFPPGWSVQNIQANYFSNISYVDGLYQKDALTSFFFKGVLMDTPENEIAQLSYGDQINEFITVYMRLTDFQTLKPYMKTKVTISKDGRTYTVLKYTERTKLLPHVKMIAQSDS